MFEIKFLAKCDWFIQFKAEIYISNIKKSEWYRNIMSVYKAKIVALGEI